MSSKLKKALIAALAVFVSVVTGYSVAPETLEALCIKVKICEVPGTGSN